MKKLLIIFTKNDATTQNDYFNSLLKEVELTENWRFVIFNETQVSKDKNNIVPNVMLFNDAISLNTWKSVCLNELKQIIQSAEKIFVIYHGNPDNRILSNLNCGEKIKDDIVKIIIELNRKENYYHKFDHHNRAGCTIDKIKKLVETRNLNIDQYHSFFNELTDIESNVLDWILPEENFENDQLEANLELLHQCLTPQGAKKAHADWLQGEGKSKYDVLIKDDFIKEIGDDPFHPDYIKALRDLRDELLKEY